MHQGTFMLRLLVLICLLFLISCASRQTVELRSQKTSAHQIIIKGGNGESIEDAVVIIGVGEQGDGMDAEYGFISNKQGLKNKEWRLIEQTIVKENNKIFDLIEIEIIQSSAHRIYYFDVSAFPWKKK